MDEAPGRDDDLAGTGSLIAVILAEAPSVADWIAAVGQAAGALFTAAAVAVAVWLGWRDRKWRRADEADRDAAQARQITVETDFRWHDYDERTMVALVRNGSAFPITDLSVVNVRNDAHPGAPWTYDYGDYPDPDIRVETSVLGSGEKFRVRVSFTDPGGTPTDLAGGTTTISIEFLDAAGLRWRRDGTATPARVLARQKSAPRQVQRPE